MQQIPTTAEPIDWLRQEHLKMLEAMSELWPINRARKQCIQTEDFSRIPEIDEEQKDVVKRVNQHLVEVLKWRYLWQRAYLEKGDVWRKKENERCKNDFVGWINSWCFTLDPRLTPLGISPIIPFILWPEQERILKDIDYQYKNGLPAILEKSRETGATWMLVAMGTHHWLFDSGFKLTLASRQEKLVDELGNPDALFSKVRFIIYKLPVVMRPTTFEKENGPNDNLLRINNPDNESSIIGEAGDNIGRGGRSSMCVIDEAAFLEHPENVDKALSSNTRCQVDISTPNGLNNFYRKRKSGGIKVLTLRWYKDPTKNKEWRNDTKPAENAWYKLQEERFAYDPTIVKQEIDIDYNASVAGVFIESKWVQAAVDFDLEEKPHFERSAGFDVAGGGKNKSVYIHRCGPVVKMPRVLHGETSTQCAWQAIELAEQDNVSVMNYDMDGIGEGVYGLYKSADRPFRFRVNGIRGAIAANTDLIDEEGRKGNEKFMNKRGELWWRVRERFRKTYEHVNKIRFYPDDELISIPNDTVLISELSSPKEKRTSSGKIGVESKIEMQTRGVESPDHADALIYSFADETDSKHVIDRFDPTESARQIIDTDIEPSFSRGEIYVVLVQAKDLNIYALCCLWVGRGANAELVVFDEISFNNPQPSEVIAGIREKIDEDVKPIKEWIANEDMFKDLERGKTPPWMLFKKAGVKLHRNYSDEYTGSIMLVNSMFNSGIIKVHKNCEKLIYQLSSWSINKGRPNDNFGMAMALCQLVTRLRKKKEIDTNKLGSRIHRARFSASAIDKPSAMEVLMSNKSKMEIAR